MARRFGTDGVRGIANADLTPELALRIGRAAALTLADEVAPELPIVVGRDTRLSGTMLEAAIVAGIASAGRDALTIGIVPTPGIATITRYIGAAAGIVISASHNPIEDNGIKIFGGDGFKLRDADEDHIEALLESDDVPRPTHGNVGVVRSSPGLLDRYMVALNEAGSSLAGLTLVVDAAYGAAYKVGPASLKHLGANVVALHAEPDGERINVECGATDLRALSARVKDLAAADPSAHVLGVAFDGDADRALFVDERGSTVNGDHLMLMLAREHKKQGTLAGDTVVGTVMSNVGLERALRESSIELLRAPVGDRYVLQQMRDGGYTFGGEQSGHIVDLTRNTTGDGPMTAVVVFSLLAREGCTLHALTADLQIYPQVLVNVRVTGKRELTEHEDVAEAIKRGRDQLGEEGRILVRPSGTEPLVRVMVEGADEGTVHAVAHGVAGTIERVAGE